MHGSFHKMLRETIHESQKCQRNWDLSQQIREKDKDLIGIEDEFTIWQEMSAKAQEVCNGLGSKKVAQLL